MISCGNCPYLDNCEENDECPFWEDEDYQIIKKAIWYLKRELKKINAI